jgi:hypothetical protein
LMSPGYPNVGFLLRAFPAGQFETRQFLPLAG